MIIIRDNSGVAEKLAGIMSKKGFNPVLVSLPLYGKQIEVERNFIKNEVGKNEITSYEMTSYEEGAIEELFGKLKESYQDITGFIYISPVVDMNKNQIDFFRPEDKAQAKEVFLMAKHFNRYFLQNQPELNKNFFLAVTRFDGELGLGGKVQGNVIQGSFYGLIKSLQQEWEKVFCRAIDIHPQCENKLVAEYILEELEASDSENIEIGRGMYRERITLGLKERYGMRLSNKLPQKKDVFLVPGGGRGITAQCAIGLAKEYGCKFLLLGRTVLKDELDTWALGKSEKIELQESLMHHLRKEKKNIKPVEIEKLLNSVMNQIEIKKTISKISEAGGEAVYMSCDVTDEEAVHRCIMNARHILGEITGVLNGAGVLADKKIQRKTSEDFDNVFNTKINGFENILKNIEPDRIKFLFFFSSIAAFFGSGGQCDYSMANEVLNKFAHNYKRLYPDTIISAINWGPWDGGMVNDTLKILLQMTGIKVIPIETGVRYLLEEIKYNRGMNNCQIVVNCLDRMYSADAEKRFMKY